MRKGQLKLAFSGVTREPMHYFYIRRYALFEDDEYICYLVVFVFSPNETKNLGTLPLMDKKADEMVKLC